MESHRGPLHRHQLLVCVARKVGWTLVAILAVMLDRDERRLEGGGMEETHSEMSLDDVANTIGSQVR
jgi:hypothetical protein